MLDNNNNQFTKESFIGKWSLVFFGYSKCPDVCPTELYLLSAVLKRLQNENKILPQVVFISLDPKRDTVSTLKTYVEHFHPKFIGVTGQQDQIDKLVRKMGVIYEKVYEQDGKYQVIVNDSIPKEYENSYLVNHSARIHIVNPAGKLFGVFASPHNVDNIANDIATLQN